MPRNPKIFFHGGCHFITMSVEEGFMFPPNLLINEVIKKCLAQAQALHPVRISDIQVLSTHIHLFIQVINPQDVVDFIERFKCESAHIINRLLGRKKKTVWCEGYDSPLIDDLPTAISKIAYIYENPSKDGLVGSIRQYSGVNSYQQRLQAADTGAFTKTYSTRRIARSDFKALPKKTRLSLEDYRKLRRKLIRNKPKAHFQIDQVTWMERFGVITDEEKRRVCKQIIAEVAAREEGHHATRKAEGRSVLGARRVAEQPIGTLYIPERTGRRMLTHSEDPEIRKRTIRWMKELIYRGKEVLLQWWQGDLTIPYPPGLFPPTGPRMVEPIYW